MFKERVVEMTPQKHGLLCQYFTILFNTLQIQLCVCRCVHTHACECVLTHKNILPVDLFFQIVKGNV